MTSDPRHPKPAVWSSTNGTVWRRVPHPTGLVQGAFPTGAIDGNTSTVLNLGVQTTNTPTTKPTTTTTTTTTFPPAQTGTGSVTTTGRLCAEGNGFTRGWTTTNGTHWHPTTTSSLANTTVSMLTRSGSHWLAAGIEGNCTATRAVLYTSSDGRKWQRLASDPHDPRSTATRYPTALTPTATGALMFVSSLDTMTTGGPDVWIWNT
jgi:hypothetical protein